MHIQELALQTCHLADQKAFYHTTLGLPLLAETADSFSVQAGTTHLHFQETESDVLYHLTFTIPRNTFPQAKGWVRERMPLLCNKDGEDEIFFPNINARSLYFCDAANNILEFMAHYDLSHETEDPFEGPSVLHVSEIGLPVEDVRELSARLKEQLGIAPYPVSRPISEEFAYLGDIYGQLVVVKIGRPWFPTEAVLADVAPVHLTISGHQEQQVQISPYPYTVTVTAS